MLLRRLVGPAGEVVAVERDARSINRAQTRAAEAGLHNVTFAQTDIAQFSSDAPFDAVAGRFILQFLPDPVGALRSLSEKVRPGGIIAFQEIDQERTRLASATPMSGSLRQDKKFPRKSEAARS